MRHPIHNRARSLVNHTGHVSFNLTESRERSRLAAVRSIRALETSLMDALQGERLRGLPQLAHHRGAFGPFFGVKVRSSDKTERLDLTPALCLAADGCLVVASQDPAGTPPVFRVAEDRDLKAEDLPSFLATLETVLPTHCDKCIDSIQGYDKIAALSDCVMGLMTVRKLIR